MGRCRASERARCVPAPDGAGTHIRQENVIGAVTVGNDPLEWLSVTTIWQSVVPQLKVAGWPGMAPKCALVRTRCTAPLTVTEPPVPENWLPTYWQAGAIAGVPTFASEQRPTRYVCPISVPLTVTEVVKPAAGPEFGETEIEVIADAESGAAIASPMAAAIAASEPRRRPVVRRARRAVVARDSVPAESRRA